MDKVRSWVTGHPHMMFEYHADDKYRDDFRECSGTSPAHHLADRFENYSKTTEQLYIEFLISLLKIVKICMSDCSTNL